MINERKTPKADLKRSYTVYLEAGLIIALVIMLTAVKLNLETEPPTVVQLDEQEVVEMEEIVQTKQIETPPPPPRPPVPVEVPNDEIIEDEMMPKLIGGMAKLQASVRYPEMARRAGIEGRVTVQFIVNEQGKVENARVVRGIGGGCDEEALKAVQQAEFEPGMQRGRPVRVQYALSINFRLEN